MTSFKTSKFDLRNIAMEGGYVTIGNPALCLFLYLTGIHF